VPMELLVNGTRRRIRSAPERPLLYVLRDELGLTGAKYGCGEGQCGACTVLIDGVAVRSCLLAARDAAGKPITTIEGLAKGEELHPVQEAFLAEDAMQCGYCTPGMILASVGLLRKTPKPGESEIRRGLQGNLCRCGTYPRIIRAVQLASRRLSGGDTHA
jgi:aerobic-type carbon monoxide dehydrogenase small subunit (CoxS/CutS family)